MKKILLGSAIALAIIGFSFTIFFPYLNSVANKDFPNEGDEPDLPGFLKGHVNKEEFMLRRAEGIGLKRGYDEENPADPKLRQTAIATMEGQQNRVASMPESEERDSLLAAWIPIGPAPIPNGQVPTGETTKPVSGRTIAIAVHPTNPNLVYVGTAQGGLYRSTDGGTNWTPLLDSALSLAVNTVAIAPSQPDTIFVGTGESGFGGNSFFGVGIYRIDNASTGSPIITGPIGGANFTGRSIGKIVVHPTNPNTIFASSTAGSGGIGGSGNNVQANRGLFRSTDALSANPTFTKLTIAGLADQNRNILDIVIDPGNPNLLLCTEVDSFNLTEGGVYRTTNALAANPTFARTFTAGTGTDASRTELALHRSGAGVVTVYAASGSAGGTLHRSIDGGATFTQQIDNNFCTPQCFYDIAVEVDPVNADRVYLGGSPALPFAFSTNGGTSFTTPVNAGLHVDTHAIAAAPSLPSTVYFGSDGGIYKSTDSGVTWTALNNTQFSATQFMGLAVHPTDPNFTIGGTQDNGTNFYQPNATWTRADFGDGGYAVIDQNAADTTNVRMYHTYFNAATLQGYGTVSTTANAMDNGWTFRGCQGGGTTTNGITCNGTVLFYAPLEQGPGNPNTIYYGTDRLYRSADAGVTHTVVSQNPITTGVPISAIGISPLNDNFRIVGLANGGIFGTDTGSTTLQDLDPTNVVPAGFIARAVGDPNNVNIVYVTLSAFGVTNVWRGTIVAGTLTWAAAAGSGGNALPQVPVSAFLVDPTNSATLYAGTDIGVFVSTDSGANWMPFGTGLPRVAVFDMAVTPSPRKLRIATHGRGLYEMVLGGGNTPTISISDVSLNEGNSGTTNFIFNVTLSAASAQTITVNFATADGTAIAGSDYVANTGTVTFNPNETSRPITVLVNGDTGVEPNETFFVNLSGAINATIADGQGLGTIVNDEGACTYSINPTSQNFGVSGGTGSVNVITQAGCPWTATSNSLPSFVDGFNGFTNQKNAIQEIIDSVVSPQGVFSNTTPIAVPGTGTSGVANPFPSNIAVSGMTGTVTDVNVTINQYTHTFPDDAAFLLVSPDGRKFVLQSDVGGGTDIVNRTYTLDDQAASSIPDAGPMPPNNGSAKPSSVGDNDGMPPPAPPIPYQQPAPAGTATLNGTFGGINPNGTWSLFVVDFFAGDEGDINGGWTLDITTTAPTPTPTPTATPTPTPGFISITSGSSGNGNGTVNYSVAANATGQPRTGTMTIAGQTFTVNQSNTNTQPRRKFDFDGDGRSDISVYRPSNGIWYLLNSQTGFTGFQFGIVTDRLAPADFDGDGRTDIAVYRNGTWFIQRSTLGFTAIQFGITEDIPQPADFDADGRAEVAVFRPSNGTWYVINLVNNQFTAFQFGISEDRPVVGDYDGDTRADYAVFRPSSGIWFYQQSTAGFSAIQFGLNTDRAVPADYDGDNRTDVAVYRPSSGTWFYQRSTLGFGAIQFGIAEDRPSPADYDGDGRADVAVFRPSSGVWFLQQSTAGFGATQFGIAEDKPIANAFVP